MELMRRRRALMAMQKPPNVLYEGYNLSFNGTDAAVINTGVYLFTQENINRDFEFVAEGIYGSITSGVDQSATIICAKHNAKAFGFIVRTQTNSSTRYNGTIYVKDFIPSTIIVRRVNGVISASGDINNPGVGFVNDVFDWPLIFGGAIADNGNPFRYAQGTIEHVKVRWL